MNRTQAKQRFTVLTGLPAKKRSVYTALWANGTYLSDFMTFFFSKEEMRLEHYDARRKEFWVILVEYLELFQEVA